MRKLVGAAALALVATATQTTAVAEEISVLSYNVHGLSWLVAKDNPRARSATIGWLAEEYDIVLVQEDFEYHRELARQLPRHVALRGNGIGYDPRLLLARLVLLPFNLLVPGFSAPYGAGLSAFVEEEAATTVESIARAYSDCSGWFGTKSDCWAQKGYLRVRVRTRGGAEVDIYNTHVDAGGSGRSSRARRRQLEELGDAIGALSPGRAVVLAGDLNTSFANASDREAIARLRESLNLADSGAGPELPQWRNRDFILYRGSEEVSLKVLRAGEASEFVNERRALSDHPALYARFDVSRLPPHRRE